jgi:hypothetical protein
MIKITCSLAVSLLLIVSMAWSQQYVATVIPYNWVEINPAHPGGLNGTNAGITGDDQNVGPFNIGFSFTFYGTAFSSVRMCSNGFASFTSTATTFTNATIPTAALPNDLLAVYWDDMNFNPTYTPPGYGTAWYYYDAPNNRFIMEWDSIAHYYTTGSTFTFEIILHTDGTIDYMYKAVIPGATTPFPSATVGIENGTGSEGVLCTFNGSGPMEPVANYGLHFGPPGPMNLNVTMAPINPPIQIPANGGQFNFNATVQNNGTQQPFWAWARDRYPDGSYTANLLGPVQINPPTGITVTRQRTQVVPGGWPAGVHYYIGYANQTVSYPAADADSFMWTKLTTADGGPYVLEALCFGEPFPYEVKSEVPMEFSLIGAYPNPFNPTTTIHYTLPENSHVIVNVYNMQGRQIVQLVNGTREAGAHQVTFDGSNLSSGVYLYTLQAGHHNALGKMVLVK